MKATAPTTITALPSLSSDGSSRTRPGASGEAAVIRTLLWLERWPLLPPWAYGSVRSGKWGGLLAIASWWGSMWPRTDVAPPLLHRGHIADRACPTCVPCHRERSSGKKKPRNCGALGRIAGAGFEPATFGL